MIPDELDRRLLEELKIDSRRSVRQLAKSLGESPSTIYNRVKRLEAKEIIKRFTVALDYDQLQLPATAFVFVNVDNTTQGRGNPTREVARAISEIKGVYEVHILSGVADILVKVRGKSIQEIGNKVLDEIRIIPAVKSTSTASSFDSILRDCDITPAI